MSTKQLRAAFEPELAMLPLASLLPTKEVTDHIKRSAKYRCIAASLDEVGLVEPLVVYRKPDHRGRYLLLDGHLRRLILMERDEAEAECLLARDDEAFTYNKRINRLAVVQECFLIVRAIERGVPEAKLAKALGVKIDYVKRRKQLLRGICTEAADFLKDKPVNPVVFDVLRKLKRCRQREACRLMVASSTYSSAYAKALLTASSEEDLVRPRRRPPPPIVTSADLALMERELKTAQKDFATVEASYGSDMVNLVIATRYVASLLQRPRIVAYLADNHPEIARELHAIVASTSPEQPEPKSAPEAKHAGASLIPKRDHPSRTFVPGRGQRWRLSKSDSAKGKSRRAPHSGNKGTGTHR